MQVPLSRWLSLSGLFTSVIALGVACSSSSRDQLNGGGGSMGSDAADSGVLTFDTTVVFDAVQTTDAPYVKCGTETCTRGDFCIVDQQVGGAVNFANEAGMCPDGDVLPEGSVSGGEAGSGGEDGSSADVGTGPIVCQAMPTYHCKGLPDVCMGVLTCACAEALCAPNYKCQGAQGLTLSCMLDAP